MIIGSLFSGVGGLELGLEWAGLGSVAFQVEINPWCHRVLAKHWPQARRYYDVTTISGAELGYVDLLCGGFPCQDVSGAGKGAGLAGARSGLWYQFARLVGEIRPEWVVIENVASGANRWVDAVVCGLAEHDYESIPFPISAADCGAPHRRARIFVVAWRVPYTQQQPVRLEPGWSSGSYRRSSPESGFMGSHVGYSYSEPQRESNGQQSTERGREPQGPVAVGAGYPLAHTHGDGLQAQWRGGLPDHRSQFGHDAHGRSGAWSWPPGPGDLDAWRDYIAAGGPEPSLRRAAHGFPCGMARLEWEERLKALGNAVMPQCAERAGWIVRELAEALRARRIA